jgi:hypothetical protein
MLKLFPGMLIVLCLLLANCGGGKYCLNPEVVKNNINVHKELVNNKTELKLDNQNVFVTKSDMFKIEGYFKKHNKHVHITKKAVENIRCYDKDNNLLWTYPRNDSPHRTLTMSLYEGKDESFVILLEWILLENTNETLQSIRILDEDGNIINQFILPGYGSIYKSRFGDISAIPIFWTTYLIAEGGDGIGIFDFDDGKLITYLYTQKVALKNPQVMELEKNGKKYVLIYADLMSYAQSSLIFILSDQWELLYEEVINRSWLHGKIVGTKDNFIIDTLDVKDCKYTGNNNIWKYTINR